jgi:hypothetical protein
MLKMRRSEISHPRLSSANFLIAAQIASASVSFFVTGTKNLIFTSLPLLSKKISLRLQGNLSPERITIG